MMTLNKKEFCIQWVFFIFISCCCCCWYYFILFFFFLFFHKLTCCGMTLSFWTWNLVKSCFIVSSASAVYLFLGRPLFPPAWCILAIFSSHITQLIKSWLFLRGNNCHKQYMYMCMYVHILNIKRLTLLIYYIQ